MVNKKRGRPRGKKNSPKFTFIPLSILKIVAQEQELIPVSLEWLATKGGDIKNPQPQASEPKALENKIEYKITEFE
tara:strand:- start:651 stop:878 length:228 start_codon:yes stop_codon:yes gene_type:complete